MIIGVPREIYPGERRVAIIPASAGKLSSAEHSVVIQKGAGVEAGYSDQDYEAAGATVLPNSKEVFATADCILRVRGPGANPVTGERDIALLREGQILIGFLDPLGAPDSVSKIASTGATSIAMEFMPRTTAAQGMDALSSMATVAGYKAVLEAANIHGKIFPMLMTAAGTISPISVFVIGAGVAGLQAIATAKRLGAVVKAYDVRPAAAEQIASVGAKPVQLALDSEDSEGEGGYAKAKDEDFYAKQRELLGEVIAKSDVVITTAAIPGEKSPLLVTGGMVEQMRPGSVIVDLAAERGGNCELTQPDETVIKHGVTVMGPTNLPSTVPFHASKLYSRNLRTLINHLNKDGELLIDMDDEITRCAVITHDGKVVNERIRELLSQTDKPVDDGMHLHKEAS